MRNIVTLIVAVVSIALSATRVYDIEPFKNYNGRVAGDQYHGIGQTFVATCDSFLWAEFFVGKPNDSNGGKHYNVEIQEYPNGLWVVRGEAPAGKSYEYTKAIFNARNPNAKVIKGKEYELKVTFTSNPPESINYYYNPNDPYKYGLALVPPQGSQVPIGWDLAVRIEGITRIPQDLFGTEIAMSFSGKPSQVASWDECADSAKKMGVTWDREGLHIMWPNCQPEYLGSFYWGRMDSLMLATANHSIKVVPMIANYTCPGWAIHAQESVPWIDTIMGYPCPRNLFDSITDAVDTINKRNFLANYIYHWVKRYGPAGTFWSSHLNLDSFRVKYLEVGGEANFKFLMSYLDTLHIGEYYDPTYRKIESTYFYTRGPDSGDIWKERIHFRDTIFYRTLVVAKTAAKLACPDIKILAPQIGKPFYAPSQSHEKGSEFLRYLYKRGLRGYADIITASCYQDDLRYFDWNQFKMTVDTIRTIMNDSNDAEKELWASEYGFQVGDDPNCYATESTQANGVLQAYLTTIDGTGEPFRRLDRICWFCFTNKYLPAIDIPGWALVDSNFIEHEAYFAYKQMTDTLKGKIFNKKDKSDSFPFYTY
jgi:hypothetical protein